jgi:hypothetical protein
LDLQPQAELPALLVDLEDSELLEEVETSEVLVLLELEEKETVATPDVIDLFRNKYYFMILVLSIKLDMDLFLTIVYYSYIISLLKTLRMFEMNNLGFWMVVRINIINL